MLSDCLILKVGHSKVSWRKTTAIQLLTFVVLGPRLILLQNKVREQLKLQYKVLAILSSIAEQ